MSKEQYYRRAQAREREIGRSSSYPGFADQPRAADVLDWQVGQDTEEHLGRQLDCWVHHDGSRTRGKTHNTNNNKDAEEERARGGQQQTEQER